MTLSDISIKNPVFAVMVSAAMIVFGYLGYRDMGISQFPELDFPVVNVTTTREGALPEIIDSDVTDIVEDAVSGIEGIDYIQSQSLQGQSVVTVFFHLKRDLDAAMQDVQNAVSSAMQRLPTDIDPPVVSKVNFNKFPVIWLAVYGKRPLPEISRFVDDNLKHYVQKIPGVGNVTFGGLRARNMRVWLDRSKLYRYGLDPVDVTQALRRENVERPAGYTQDPRREDNLRVMGEESTAAGFGRILIGGRDNEQILLKDVAVIEDGLEDRRSMSRFIGMPTIGLGVMRANGGNVVDVCKKVKDAIPEMRKVLPADLEIGISTDYSLFIIDDIEEVKEALLLGIVLTALVSYLFLGSIGTTLNVCVSIPTSLIGTFLAMKWFGFTINFMTLLALSLSVGVVVDDAILVLENIYRRREHGEEKVRAAILGAREISFAALAATLSIVAIFIPVAFLKGSIGRFFFQFAITTTVAVLLSLVIALTITPMLCAFFLDVRHPRRPRPRPYGGLLGPIVSGIAAAYWAVDRFVLEFFILNPVNWFMSGLTRAYAWLLKHALRHQWYVIVFSAILAASSLLFLVGINIKTPLGNVAMKPLGRELVPSEDQNRLLINLICPVSSSIDYVDNALAESEVVLKNMKDADNETPVVATFFSAVSIRPGSLISEGTQFVRLIPSDDRKLTQTQIIEKIRAKLKEVPGVRAVVLDLSTQGFTAIRGYPVDFAIQGPKWENVTALSEMIRERMIDDAAFADVNSDYRPGKQEIHVFPDPLKAKQREVSTDRISRVLMTAIGGTRIGRFTDVERRYDVRVRLLEDQRASPDQIDDLFVKNDRGKLVPVRDVVRWETLSTLPILNRYNHARKVQLTANTGKGVSQGEAMTRALDLFAEVREEMGLSEQYRVVPLGNAQAMQETIDSLWWALALGFIVAAMILGVQFNSFVHPFTVLLAVPFGVTGALATLWIMGDRLNFMSMIGLVLLAGLVKKNSIILVDYTNQLRREGLGLREAVLTACPIRLRPILMTSLATIAAAVPLALGLGPGSETRGPLARSIIGGILLSTVVTLFIVPIFYVLLDRFGEWLAKLAQR